MKKLIYLFILGLFFVFNPLNAQIDEDDISTLQNPAQAQKAENLADISQEEAESEAQKDLDTKQENFNEAQTDLALDPTNPDLQDAFDLAQQELNNALDNLANATGTTRESIEEMRAEGMGWGDIAHELGIHPGVLGLGHKKQELGIQTARKLKSFKDESFTSNNTNNSGQGLRGKSNKINGSNTDGIGKGNSGNNAGGNGKGNSGGNGKGGGKK